MFGVIAKVLAATPAWVTNRVAPKARSIVYRSLANNSTRQELEYGWLFRLLLWGGERPLAFSLGVGAICALLACLAGAQPSISWPGISAPNLSKEYGHAGYFGTAWAVQATLVVLVYPIVVTFITILLQRRATAKVALRVYVLDSAILPAGTSSITLVAVMTAEYFVSLYVGNDWVVRALMFNGVWLIINIALTGYFLSRTIRFLQEEEGHEAFVRLAINKVFRLELVNSLKQHLVVNTPERESWTVVDNGMDPILPQVVMQSLGCGRAAVVRHLSGIAVLDDVHLGLIAWVSKRWWKRALTHPPPNQHIRALLVFPAMVGESTSGVANLCLVDNGPPLTALEKVAVNAAFVYRPQRRRVLSLSTAEMLTELVTEVQSLAEQHRFSASSETFRAVLQLHGTLLRSCEEKTDGDPSSAASLAASPYGWGTSSFHREWLSPYRPVAALAVRLLPEDLGLFNRVAYAATTLARAAPTQPASLIAESLLVPTHLAYQLGLWWRRQMQASASAGESAHAGKLPEPYAAIYEKAVVSFIGGWSSLDVNVLDSTHRDNQQWWSLCNRALAYANHIDATAKLLLSAVARGDEVAATWLSDQFLKWWGNRRYELNAANLDYDPDFAKVRLSLVYQDWSAAKEELSQMAACEVSIDIAGRVVSLAVGRYWESMRLVLMGLLLPEDNGATATGSLRIRIVASLVQGSAFYAGGNVMAEPRLDADVMLSAILDLCFSDAKTTSRLDGFCENLSWEEDTPVVSGWTYGGSQARTGVESMLLPYAQLLLALPQARRPVWPNSKKAIEVWWRDVRKLERVSRFGNVLHGAIAGKSFRPYLAASDNLRQQLELPKRNWFIRIHVARAAQFVCRRAAIERRLMLSCLVVSTEIVAKATKIVSSLVIGDPEVARDSYPFCRFTIGRSSVTAERSFVVSNFTQEQLSEGMDAEISQSFLASIARYIRREAVEGAFAELVIARSYTPIVPANEVVFLQEVARRSSALEAAGRHPLVLVPEGELLNVFRPYRWSEQKNASLPTGVVLGYRKGIESEFADGYINEAQVVKFSTPGRDCYVVPLDEVSTLSVEGSAADVAFRGSYALTVDNHVSLTWNWAASF